MAKTCRPESMNLTRLFARLFVIGGGIFWVTAVFGADYGYRGASPLVSARNALLPLALTVAVLAVGWFFEYVAAGILTAGTGAVIAWGVTAAWETGVWALMVTTLIGPMLTAAMLFIIAARMEGICAIQPLPAKTPAQEVYPAPERSAA